MSTAPTALQEALWWIHQRARTKSVYHITWRLGCGGPVDFAALQTAWAVVVDRHEALRSSISPPPDLGGALTLAVSPQARNEAELIEVDDPGSLPVADVLRLLAEESHEQELPLDVAPLARLRLVRVGTETELLLTVHHLALDGWAVQLLMDDLSVAYGAAVLGEPARFDREAESFSAYAQEEHQAREAGRWKPSLDAWAKILDGATATTVVPDSGDDNAYRTALPGAPGTTLRYAFSDEATDGMVRIAARCHATPFAAMLGALQIVLARGGAGPDVALGVLAANRLTQRDQGLVGYLVNLCVARATVEDGDTVAAVAGRARDTIWSMLAHQGVPYPAVYAALPEPARDALGDVPPILLNYLGPIGTGLRLGDIELTLHRSPNRAARSDIAIAYWDSEAGITAEVEYHTGRYPQETVLRLLHDLDLVLAEGGEDPERTTGSLRTRTATTASRPPATERPSGSPLPESAAAHQVSRAWAAVIGRPPADADEDFFTAGGRSLKVLELAAAIEAETGTALDVVSWLAAPTPRGIVERLTGGQFSGTGPGTGPGTLVTLRQGTGTHLHLVHGAGGAANDYRDLLAALPEHWTVTLSQEREPADSLAEMAVRYRADLDAAGLRPDLLGGWSMGGMLAHELALGYQDDADGRTPGLVVIDSPPPIGYPVTAELRRQRMAAFTSSVCLSLGVELSGSLPRSTGEPASVMLALSACLGAAGHPVRADTLTDRWTAYDRHAMAIAAHVSERHLHTAALVVTADLGDEEAAEWTRRITPGPRLLHTGTDHFAVLRPPMAAEIAGAVRALEETMAARP